MKQFYSLIDSLNYLKEEISRLERELKCAKTLGEKRDIQDSIQWNLRLGLEMYHFANKKERSQEILDFFLDRTKERPDLKRLHALTRKGLNQEERKETRVGKRWLKWLKSKKWLI